MEGTVQGVGFRPFVHGLATRLGLAGLVRNDAGGVVVEVEGDPERVAAFREALVRQAPPLAVVERVTVDATAPQGSTAFVIVPSSAEGDRRALVAPDVATCEDCLRELDDPADRRYRYPFVNCTNCGPRFTIVRDVPYDRPNTTMAGFPMCAECKEEYHDPTNRRFHAQPVCCPACGPSLRLLDAEGEPLAGDPVERAAELLLAGHVVAVKGLGGYHLAVDALLPDAVAALRARKRREEKPFALMVPDLATARALCHLDEAGTRLLTSPRRPIVLLSRREGDPGAPPVAPAVAPGTRYLGVMLPYTPLHHLLARALARPFVLTSGNRSDEPIAYEDGDALTRLRGIADAFLTHDRPIHTHADDTVTRAFAGRELPVRRSRGYAPQPLALPVPPRRPVLACGAELKSTFCLAKDGRAFVSQHIGDLEDAGTLRAYTTGIEHFCRLFGITPEVVAHDLHPEYLSTKYALSLEGVEPLGVQHHHAHVAACLADSGERGPVIGVAFDGLGYGPDGTLWGGEFLVADLAGFERAGSFEPVPLPGGAAAVREPWRMAAAYLHAAFGGAPPELGVTRRNQARWEAVLAAARAGVGSPPTSSAGRLFDAAAALLGVRDRVSYEGQAAAELEQLADPAERAAYPAGIAGDRPFRARGADLVRAAAEDLRRGTAPPLIAARFHNGVADVIVRGCELLREATGLGAVALSGGVFQNLFLLGRVVPELEARGFRVLLHTRVPPNDGGISLGQAAVAAARGRG